MYYPGHAGVKGNDLSDSLAGKTAITSGLGLGRNAELKSLRHYIREQNQRHHTIDRLEEKGLERERRSPLKGGGMDIVNFFQLYELIACKL